MSRPIANLRSMLATSPSRPLPDAGGRLIDQRLARTAVFGRPRRHSKKSFAGSQSQRASPIRSIPYHQVGAESETQLTLVKQVKSARATIRQTHLNLAVSGPTSPPTHGAQPPGEKNKASAQAEIDAMMRCQTNLKNCSELSVTAKSAKAPLRELTNLVSSYITPRRGFGANGCEYTGPNGDLQVGA